MMPGRATLSGSLNRRLEASILREANGRGETLERWAEEERQHRKTIAALDAEIAERRSTIAGLGEQLRDMMGIAETAKPVAEIQRVVAAHFGVSVKEMLSDRRVANLAWPRQVAVYLSKSLTRYSMPELGRLFGGRDHTTIHHAIKTVGRRISEKPIIAAEIAAIRCKITEA